MLSKWLALTLSFAVTLAALSLCPLLSVACATDANTHLNSRATPASLRPALVADDVVMEWNLIAATLTLQAVPALAAVQQTRVMAIFHLAVHDAVNGITGEYETYLSPGAAGENASPKAAAISAAYYALKDLFPGSGLEQQFSNSLLSHDLTMTDPGIEYGHSAAAAILAIRSNDHSSEAQFNYDAPNAGQPGVWVRLNNAPASLPGWGEVSPFVLRSISQFQPDAPPDLTSEQYAKDYNEIKKIGVKVGSTRTSEQTNIALFWRASPTAIWNTVLRQVVATRDLDLSQQARLFALFYLASADASIACWKAKYKYNFWRPQSAITNGDSDDNDLTTGVSGWEPLVATPPHPEYPSGHSTNSSAMATILISEFGDNPGVSFAVTQTGITRTWTSFSEPVQEVIDARVYSGIHFRNSDEVGARMGRQIAQFVKNHALRRSSHH
jgi:hypothetical protein